MCVVVREDSLIDALSFETVQSQAGEFRKRALDTLRQAARLHSFVVFVEDLDSPIPAVKRDAASL